MLKTRAACHDRAFTYIFLLLLVASPRGAVLTATLFTACRIGGHTAAHFPLLGGGGGDIGYEEVYATGQFSILVIFDPTYPHESLHLPCTRPNMCPVGLHQAYEGRCQVLSRKTGAFSPVLG